MCKISSSWFVTFEGADISFDDSLQACLMTPFKRVNLSPPCCHHGIASLLLSPPGTLQLHLMCSSGPSKLRQRGAWHDPVHLVNSQPSFQSSKKRGQANGRLRGRLRWLSLTLRHMNHLTLLLGQIKTK
ncbi:hypothetical protein AMTR_s00141p00055890 [Amborella trichopoda]|uniref:Uncharacterized protein n=1 Tax=Amborella trichopoda TaxID=13333 RepID=W1PAR5_AMBTC|nr:hypothetical protein AMTR_s00141p00055890 [Amborella trichopoda]